MSIKFEIQDGKSGHLEAMADLFPLLADFEAPAHRDPRDLWYEDLQCLKRWAKGEQDNVFVLVARDSRPDASKGSPEILGVSMVSLKGDFLNGEPSSHLEALAVHPQARGLGIGKALLKASEAKALEIGALSMTLHVFEANQRARRFYDHNGFAPEILKYRKTLE